MKLLAPILGVALSLLIAVPAAHADCEDDCGSDPRAAPTLQPELTGEVDPEMRYAGGWMFAVGLPVSIIAGVAALESIGEGPLADKPVGKVGSVAGTVLFGVGTVAWTAGLALWFVGRQPVATMPSLSMGPSGTFVHLSGSTSLFGG